MPKMRQIVTLLIFISFGSVNAVIISPALPQIQTYFSITAHQVQGVITWFLVGYTLTQIIFGALSNITGRKTAAYIAMAIALLGCLICLSSSNFNSFNLLLIGRFISGFGAGAGLVLSFTIIADMYHGQNSRKMTSIITIGLAVSPGVASLIGGLLCHQFNWQGCIYGKIIYLFFTFSLLLLFPETGRAKYKFNPKIILQGYISAFLNFRVVVYAIIYGMMTSVLYVLASVTPFIAQQNFNMSISNYGLIYFYCYIGYVLGNIVAILSIKIISTNTALLIGVFISLFAAFIILGLSIFHIEKELVFFVLISFVLFGIPFVFINASVLSLASHEDKANGSSVLNLISMGSACITLILLSFVHGKADYILPISLIILLVINLLLVIFSNITLK